MTYKEGAKKAKETYIKRYGSYEAYIEEMRRRGSKADKSTPRGFAKMDKDKVKELSKKAHEARWKDRKN